MTNHENSSRSDSTATPQGAIIVGYDASPSSLAAVRRAVSLGSQLQRDVRVVVAWHMPISYSGFPLTGWSPQDDAQQMLEALASTLFPQGVPSSFTAVSVEGEPAKVLINESVGAEMLLVGSRGHGGFAGLLLGSVSSACAEHATCPVLIMRTHVSTSHEVAKPELAGASA
jgi:nucleotide-binding universal stress UspA family protein